MNAEPQPLLFVQKMTRIFPSGDQPVHALEDVSFKIYPGEFVAVMGQSGSGKSTLMNILGCLDRATSGQYKILGQDVAVLSNDRLAMLRRESFGFIFQRYNLLSTLTALENVEIPAIYAGMDAAQRRARAAQLLDQLGLSTRLHHYPSQLSGGQQQRVAIARALMNAPPILLADEPTGALDSKSGHEVMALLKELAAEGRTIIIITHDRTVAEQADRILFIADGRLTHEEIKQDIQKTEKVSKKNHTQVTLLDSLRSSVDMAFRALRVNIFRTILTLLGIVVGVASVVAMLSIGEGSKRKVLDQIASMGTNLLSVQPGAMNARGSDTTVTLTLDDAKQMSELPSVAAVVPVRSGRVTVRYKEIDAATNAQGVGIALPQARAWPVAQGAFFSTQDLQRQAPVVVLGDTVRKTLFPHDENPLGAFVLIRNIPFEVIGVMSVKGAAPFGGDQDDVMFVPVTTALGRLFGQNYLSAITLQVDAVAHMDDTEQAVTALLRRTHQTDDFRIRNMASLIASATETQNTLSVLLGTVAAISLVVGGIGVMNIMLVSVTERTREIGIRMAVGARARDILLQFNTESAVIGALGGFLGLALGFLAGWISNMAGMKSIFTIGPPILAFSSAFLTGVLFGYLPARKAARLDPVVALASE